jgi:hypothetical protein
MKNYIAIKYNRTIIPASAAIIVAIFAIVHSSFVLAAATSTPLNIENLPDKTVYNDFVVGPGKFELNMNPGETRTTEITVSNRLGKNKTFQLEVEDFEGSRDPAQTVVLLDSARGPYSLKDYVQVPFKTFTIGNAERVRIPIIVHIPTDAAPGGLYGSVVISTVTSPTDQTLADGSSAGTSPIITRIGTLYFVRVAGDVKEDGKLTDFSLKDNAHFIASGPLDFQMLYEDNGTIHENPYGTISVTNMFGSEVAHMDVEPWFALPNSLRLREVVWDAPFLIGRYVAKAEINRGYGNIIDTKEVTFWVIPWRVILIVFIGLVIIIIAFRWIASKFSIVVKK